MIYKKGGILKAVTAVPPNAKSSIIDHSKINQFHVVSMEGLELYFPYEPYAVQAAYMKTVV